MICIRPNWTFENDTLNLIISSSYFPTTLVCFLQLAQHDILLNKKLPYHVFKKLMIVSKQPFPTFYSKHWWLIILRIIYSFFNCELSLSLSLSLSLFSLNNICLKSLFIWTTDICKSFKGLLWWKKNISKSRWSEKIFQVENKRIELPLR